MRHLLQLLLTACLALHLTACNKMTPADPAPRHQALKAFDPHREDFTCKHEADAVPPIDPEADLWNQEGLYVTRFVLWPDQMDWKKAEQLWTKAAERKHWKAMMNLASLYEKGQGEGQYAVAEDSSKAVAIVEEAMRLGIPAAYDKMGNYHTSGAGGIRPDNSRAWAFWQLAAEMGNPQALTHIGVALAATYDGQGFWGNMPIAIKMLDCAAAQGFGQAAYELGVVLDGSDSSIGEDYAGGLKVLHEGVKFGSEKAANYLFATFDEGEPMVGNLKDPIRARRYKTLADALYHNPDLRFPNLDKVLPLPPAALPAWDGNPESLVDAAKGVVLVAPPKPSPGAQRTGRAHIPEGWQLGAEPLMLRAEASHGGRPMALYEQTPVTYTGYWLPYLLAPSEPRHAEWNARQVPLLYKRGEYLEPHRQGLVPRDGRVMWDFLGVLEQAPARQPHALVRAGTVREVVRDMVRYAVVPRCSAGKNCPQTGVWMPVANDGHPQAGQVDLWWRQAFIEAGQPMPDARAWGLDTVPEHITWYLMEAGAWTMDAEA